MATPNSVWGIDIGNCALKALKLGRSNGQLQVEAFDIIEHPKILSQPDADRNQLIRNALEQFLARNNVAGSMVAVAVPGQSSFTRFVKLPPVEPKKIPDIVRFEAEQQIPFPIDEVIWQWQTFQAPDSPEAEVGIFAMKRADVTEVLDHFSEVALTVDVVQMAPLSLYNFALFDKKVAPDGATLVADVGADKTDLVVADGANIWTRTIQIGGNNFTEALVRAFKLSFAKAEKLKRTAATSKYARQIFQAMRPVFSDLVQEIQRSVGYYTSLHRETRFKKLLGLGNGFRLPGLQKFLEQNLNMPVVRVDSFNRLQPAGSVNTPNFTENVLGLGVAYGLAIQAVAEPRIDINLLPHEIARKRMWDRKRPWLTAAAALLLVFLGVKTYRARADLARFRSDENARSVALAESVQRRQNKLDLQYRTEQAKGKEDIELGRKHYEQLGYRDFWPSAYAMVTRAIRDVGGEDQQLLTRYAEAVTKEQRKAAWDAMKAKPRSERTYVRLQRMDRPVFLADELEIDLPAEEPPAAASRSRRTAPSGPKTKKVPGFRVTLVLRTCLPPAEAERSWNSLYYALNRLDDETLPSGSKAYPSLQVVRVWRDGGFETVGGADDDRLNRRRQRTDTTVNDPLFPAEDASRDTVFRVVCDIAVVDDGLDDEAQDQDAR